MIGWMDITVLFPFFKNRCERPNKWLWRMITFKTTWANFMTFTTKNTVTLIIISKYIKWEYKLQSWLNYKYFSTKKNQQRRAYSEKKKKKKCFKKKLAFSSYMIWKLYVLLMQLGLSILHHTAMCSHSSFRMSWQKMTTFIWSAWSLIFFWISTCYGKHHLFFLLLASLFVYLLIYWYFLWTLKTHCLRTWAPKCIISMLHHFSYQATQQLNLSVPVRK